MQEQNKYFWLKLKRDFFKRHDIKIIESMPNGKDYVLFYLKLLVESVDHEGNLRFSDEIPYNEEMLSVITNTNVDIVRSAIKIFTQLNMMDILDDGTYFMNEVDKMMGFETEWARKKREYRARIKLEEIQQLEYEEKDIVHPLSDKSKSKSKNKKESIIIDNNTKEKDLKNDKKVEKNEDFIEIFECWNEKNIIKHKELTDKRKKAILKALKENSKENIKLAIEHYSTVLNDKNYFFDYKWSIEEFLTRNRGYTTFLNDGSNWVNYNKPKAIKQNHGLTSYEYDPAAPHNNRGDNDIV